MKVKFPYTIQNNLAEYVRTKQAERTIETGKTVTIRSIETEIAEYCSITIKGIKKIKGNNSIPSLPLAFKIAEYFQVSIDKIFFLKNE